MDLDDDGNADILSGSYRRVDQERAGLLQVLWGTDDGGYHQPQVLNGSNGEPLIIPAGEGRVEDQICTRPFAADLNQDGKLDLMVGNIAGTFFVFWGHGYCQFDPVPEKVQADGSDLSVPRHGDPFLIDWDRDGDLDMLSGSAKGGVFLSLNKGTPREFRFTAMTEVFPSVGPASGMRMGDAHITGPQGSTRVWADDINGDGKWDLLIGDTVSLNHPAEGRDEATCFREFQAWNKKWEDLSAAWSKAREAGQDAEQIQQRLSAVWEDRLRFLREERTGYVWLMLQK